MRSGNWRYHGSEGDGKEQAGINTLLREVFTWKDPSGWLKSSVFEETATKENPRKVWTVYWVRHPSKMTKKKTRTRMYRGLDLETVVNNV